MCLGGIIFIVIEFGFQYLYYLAASFLCSMKSISRFYGS